MSTKLNCLAVMIAVVVSTAVQASEPFLAYVPSESAISNKIPGQSMKTPVGGPWNYLEFYWLGEADPSAFGEVFLLDREYLGEPGDLSPASRGFIASAGAAAAGEQYHFETSLTLQPSTPYYVYANSEPPGGLKLSTSNGYPEGTAYEASSPFTQMPASDWGFGFAGVAVPEPSAFALAAIGLLSLGFFAWRSRRRS